MKRELDKDKKYIPKYNTDPNSPDFGKELPTHLAYPMRPIVATEFKDPKLGPCVKVERDDVDEPMIYTKDTDGYQYWLSQAKAQAPAKPDEV